MKLKDLKNQFEKQIPEELINKNYKVVFNDEPNPSEKYICNPKYIRG
jgi:hypothetical protein